MAKTKITITIEQKFLRELDKIARLKHTNRSNLIEKALRVWEKEQIEAELKKGYLAMANEDKKIAEENLKIAREILHE